MPFYLYRCSSCREENYFFHSIKKKMEKCNICEGSLERLISDFSYLKKDKNLEKANVLLEAEKKKIKEATEEIKRERIKDFKI